MYTETKEQLIARVKAIRMSKKNREKTLYIVELAYKSGHHDGWYDHVETNKGAEKAIAICPPENHVPMDEQGDRFCRKCGQSLKGAS